MRGRTDGSTTPPEQSIHQMSVNVIRKQRNILIVGDRVLIKPDDESERMKHGLYLPPGVGDQERVGSGLVVKVGPGYPVPNPEYTEGEAWNTGREPARYIPLQAREGDHALFLRIEAIDIEFDEQRYLIVSQPAILMLVRQEYDEGSIEHDE